MTALVFALLAPSAPASPVENGVQAQIHPGGFRFLSEQLTGSTWAIAPPKALTLHWQCYDLTILDPNLDVEFGRVDLSSTLNRLVLDAGVVEAVGRDMTLQATSTGIPCVDFQTVINEVALRDLVVTGEMFPQIFGDSIDVTFLEPLDIDADTTIDLAPIPDVVEEGLLFFLEGALLNFAEKQLQDQLPGLLASLTVDGFLYQSEIAGFSIGVTPSLVGNSDAGLYAAADVDLGGDGGPGRVVDLGPRRGSHVAVGLTQQMVEEVAVAAWDQGLIRPESETTLALIEDLLAGLGLTGDLKVQLGAGIAPRVRVADGGVSIALPSTTLVVRNAADDVLLSLVADLDGLLDLRVHGGSLRLTAHELTADVISLEASRILEGGPENLEQFLEDWVVRAAASAIDDLEVYRSHFEALGYVLRVDESAYEEQAIIAWATLFAADDPRVDRTPPDTSGQLALEDGVLVATFSGRDDRPGDLVYSYRVNGSSWSSWSSETEARVPAVVGDNRFEVKARDVWHNEDPSPAAGTVVVPEARRRCGCATGGAPLPALGLALGLLVLVRRQR